MPSVGLVGGCGGGNSAQSDAARPEPIRTAEAGMARDAGKAPSDAGDAGCAGDCSGHGSCVQGSCACDLGYVGDACAVCAADWQISADGKVCSPPPCDGSPCVPPVESRIEQWGTALSDQAYGVALGADGEALVVGGAGASLSGQMSAGESDLFLSGRFAASDATKNWTRQWGTPQFDYGHGLVRDQTGNVFVVGDAGGKLGEQHYGGADAVLSMFRPDHTPAWTTQWGTVGSDLPQALARDAQGNLLVVGWTDGDLQGKAAGGLDVFVTKLNADGVIQWSAQWGGTGDDAGFGISVDAAGNSYICGATASAGDRNIFCRKLSPAGSEVWNVTWGSPADDVALDVAWHSDGHLWITGWSDGELGGAGSGGAFLSKIETEHGATLWTEQFAVNADDSGVSLALTASGDFFLSGVTQGASGEDVFIQKRDYAGAVLWTQQHGTAGFDRVESSVASPAGALYLVGQTSGSFPGFKNRGSTDNFMLVVAP